MQIDLFLVGIGMGNPDHLTNQAKKALKSADLIIIPDKGLNKSGLCEIRMALCEKLLNPTQNIAYMDFPSRKNNDVNYLENVEIWHDQISTAWEQTIISHLPYGGKIAFMIWGDPTLYDSSLRIVERLRARRFKINLEVIPGLSAIQLLTSAHKIPLNNLAGHVTISTGRNLREKGWPEDCETLVIMLDGETSFTYLTPERFFIYWGAYLGMEQEILISGPLDACRDNIIFERAKARKKIGWVMDIYLLKIL